MKREGAPPPRPAAARARSWGAPHFHARVPVPCNSAGWNARSLAGRPAGRYSGARETAPRTFAAEPALARASARRDAGILFAFARLGAWPFCAVNAGQCTAERRPGAADAAPTASAAHGPRAAALRIGPARLRPPPPHRMAFGPKSAPSFRLARRRRKNAGARPQRARIWHPTERTRHDLPVHPL